MKQMVIFVLWTKKKKKKKGRKEFFWRIKTIIIIELNEKNIAINTLGNPRSDM